MKGKDLFKELGYIHPKYYEEAEKGVIPKARLTFRKPLLAAAIIAMSLLLAGCAVAYVLHMQDLKVGEQEETKPVLATDGISIEGYEPATYQTLTLAGLKGSDGYQAALEWYEFKQGYDPDHVIQSTSYSEGTRPEFPAEFEVYNLYSQEMKDKLDSIMAAYSLKPIGQRLEFRTVKNLCTALGIEKIQASEDAVSVQVKSGSAFENGNFSLSLDFLLPEDGSVVTSTWGTLQWNRKDCFSDDTITIEDTGDWKEWNYTTAAGSQVLIIRSESDWRGWIICDRPDATMSLMLEARRDLGYNVDGKTWFEYEYMTDKQMEMVADAIDFGIQPKVATQEDAANQEGISMEATQDGYTVKLKSVETDGVFARFTFGVTAPEGTVINKMPDGSRFDISTTNYDILTPASGSISGGGTPLNPKEDGDGLDNTQDVVIDAVMEMEDGSKPFAVGREWNVRFEDLISIDWSHYGENDTILAEGEWLFPITIEESFGDFQEIELAPEPVAVQASVGMTMDGTDVMDDAQLVSFTLRSLGATARMSEDSKGELSYRGSHIYAVMKNGTQVELHANVGGMGILQMTADSPIDVTQVDHVILTDGTKLMAP